MRNHCTCWFSLALKTQQCQWISILSETIPYRIYLWDNQMKQRGNCLSFRLSIQSSCIDWCHIWIVRAPGGQGGSATQRWCSRTWTASCWYNPHQQKKKINIFRLDESKPLSLHLHLHPHLHFNIYNANANIEKLPTHWRKYQTRLRFYARILQLPACVRDMQGAFYICGMFGELQCLYDKNKNKNSKHESKFPCDCIKKCSISILKYEWVICRESSKRKIRPLGFSALSEVAF